MAKKKQPRNGFYFFMKALQQEERRRGNNYTMAQMSAIAHPRWNSLSEEEKKGYEGIAKEEKALQKATFDGKYTSDGYSISYIQKLEQEEMEKQERSVKEVQAYVNSLKVPGSDCLGNIASNSFYIMSFNLLCQTEESEYIPIEIGIIEYSIKDGIKNTYHKFIDPGPIPIGYSSLAKEHSEETHNIPIIAFEEFDKDYTKISREIRRFIKDHSFYPMVFSMTDQLTQTEGCLKWLHSVTHDTSLECVAIRDLLVLLLELRDAANDPIPTKSVAQEMLSKNVFDYIPGINCTFHESIDNTNCALGYAKRLGYMLSDALCQRYDITPTVKHLPKRSEAQVVYEVVKVPVAKTTKVPKLLAQTRPRFQQTRATYYHDVEKEPSTSFSASCNSASTSSESHPVIWTGRGAGRGRPLNKS